METFEIDINKTVGDAFKTIQSHLYKWTKAFYIDFNIIQKQWTDNDKEKLMEILYDSYSKSDYDDFSKYLIEVIFSLDMIGCEEILKAYAFNISEKIETWSVKNIVFNRINTSTI